MDFLKALEKAKQLGLTKDEFLPIYMQELQDNAANLSHHNLEWERFRQSNENTDSASGETSIPQNMQQQNIPTESQQVIETLVHDLRSSLDMMKDLTSSKLNSGTAIENDSFIIFQHDIHNFLQEIYKDVQNLLYQQNGSSEQPGAKTVSMVEKLQLELLQKFEDHSLKLKNDIQVAQEEIVAKLSGQNFTIENMKVPHNQRHEELFLFQGTLMRDNHVKLQVDLQQLQAHLSAMITHVTSLVLGTFNKICEFQNITCAEMQGQKKNLQFLQINSSNISSSVMGNTNLLNTIHVGHASLQNQNQNQYLELLNSISHVRGMLCDMQVHGYPHMHRYPSGDAVVNVETNLVEEQCKNDFENLSHTSLLSLDLDRHVQLLSQDLDMSFYNETLSSGSVIDLTYDFSMSNMSDFLKSRKEYQRVIYDEMLGCCLRASIYTPEFEGPDEVLDITLDMCLVGTDVRLPDLLRISTEISLVDKLEIPSKWIVAKENGIFNLSRIKENGWFEVCAALLNIKNFEFARYVQNGNISFSFHVIVLNRDVNNIQKTNGKFHSELKNNLADSSDSESGEYYDATAEEIEETDLKQSLSSETFTAADGTTEESLLQQVPCDNKRKGSTDFPLPEVAVRAATEEVILQKPSNEETERLDLLIPEIIAATTEEMILQKPSNEEADGLNLSFPEIIAATTEEMILQKPSNEETERLDLLLPEIVVATEVTTEELVLQKPSHKNQETEHLDLLLPEIVVATEVTTEELVLQKPSHKNQETERLDLLLPEIVVATEVTTEELVLQKPSHKNQETERLDLLLPEIVAAATDELILQKSSHANENSDSLGLLSPEVLLAATALVQESFLPLPSHKKTCGLKLSSSAALRTVKAKRRSILQGPNLENEDQIRLLLYHRSYFFPICNLSYLIRSGTIIDSEDWYLQFLGHSVHAVLAFVDNMMMICIDYFHGNHSESLPEFVFYRCQVTLLDRTDQIEDRILGDRVEVFDLTRAVPTNWMDNCVCMINCDDIVDRFKSNDKIVLRFDFFEMA